MFTFGILGHLYFKPIAALILQLFCSVYILCYNKTQSHMWHSPVLYTGDFLVCYPAPDKLLLPAMLHQHDKARQVECERAVV